MAGCDDFLTKEPLASFQDDDFWSSENNVRGFAFGYYADRFPGYGNGDTGGVMSQRQALMMILRISIYRASTRSLLIREDYGGHISQKYVVIIFLWIE